MTDLHTAEIALGQARAAFEIRPCQTHTYVRLLECEARFLRAENRDLRSKINGIKVSLADALRALRRRGRG